MVRGGTRDGIGLLDGLTVAAVVSVLVLVSIPRLRDLALAENEAGACALAEALSAELAAAREEGASAGELTLRDLVLRAERGRALADASWTADGRLERHGYVFELVRGEAGPAVVARPLRPR